MSLLFFIKSISNSDFLLESTGCTRIYEQNPISCSPAEPPVSAGAPAALNLSKDVHILYAHLDKPRRCFAQLAYTHVNITQYKVAAKSKLTAVRL